MSRYLSWRRGTTLISHCLFINAHPKTNQYCYQPIKAGENMNIKLFKIYHRLAKYTNNLPAKDAYNVFYSCIV